MRQTIDMKKRTAPEIFQCGYVCFPAELREFIARCFFREADNPVIACMCFEQQSRILCDGVAIVGYSRFVCRSYFYQFCAALPHDIRDSERTANFDQLAPGNDHFGGIGHRMNCEHHGGSVVVDDQRRLRPCQLAKEGFHIRPSFPSLPEVQIEFQI